MGCHSLQRIFLTQGSSLCLLHWQADSLPLSHLGSWLTGSQRYMFPKSCDSLLMCQFHWATGCPDIWSNMILNMSVRMLFGMWLIDMLEALGFNLTVTIYKFLLTLFQSVHWEKYMWWYLAKFVAMGQWLFSCEKEVIWAISTFCKRFLTPHILYTNANHISWSEACDISWDILNRLRSRDSPKASESVLLRWKPSNSNNIHRFSRSRNPLWMVLGLTSHFLRSCVLFVELPWIKWQPTPVFLPGKSHGQKEPGRLQSMGSQRVRHDLEINHACLNLKKEGENCRGRNIIFPLPFRVPGWAFVTNKQTKNGLRRGKQKFHDVCTSCMQGRDPEKLNHPKRPKTSS